MFVDCLSSICMRACMCFYVYGIRVLYCVHMYICIYTYVHMYIDILIQSSKSHAEELLGGTLGG